MRRGADGLSSVAFRMPRTRSRRIVSRRVSCGSAPLSTPATLLKPTLPPGVQLADPVGDGRFPRLLGRRDVLEKALRLEAELSGHADVVY